MTTTDPGRRTTGQLARHLAVRAVRMEVGIWQSLYRWTFRRPRVPAGAAAFTYHRSVLPVIITFIVVSAIELVVVDVLVHRWPAVRIPLLVLGIWGLTWMIGFLAAHVTRPHAVGPDGIRARFTADVDVDLPWDAVDAVSRRLRTREEKAPRLDRGAGSLDLWMQDRTNVEIELDRPVAVRLPEGEAVVRRVGLFADDPAAFLAAVRQFTQPPSADVQAPAR
ncbi:hypothetical protein E9529_07925 [Blastococcus sp. KM273128]|uniref:hypothetical protein n=1 Tax=Blastococcus sp. KM273128 TaxID=2570314 RepID=UPI001F1A227E|nr:hypothetical protein [Blastococcus sp. KM273128]MCF6744203.1 hypothetical protein [Blastococcus sp. KM273128]